jgi:serine/threonine protein kinase
MATGMPPHANVHYMRAIFLIPNKPPPALPDPEEFSDEFNDFIARCCQKKAEDRPTIDELLEHDFVKNATDMTPLEDFVKEALPQIPEWRKAKAEARASAGKGALDDADTWRETIGGTGTFDSGTVVSEGTSNAIQMYEAYIKMTEALKKRKK